MLAAYIVFKTNSLTDRDTVMLPLRCISSTQSVHRERDPLAPFNGRFMIIKLGLDARGAKTNGPRTAAAEEKFSAKHISSAPRCDSEGAARPPPLYLLLGHSQRWAYLRRINVII